MIEPVVHLYRLAKVGATLAAFDVLMPPEVTPDRPATLKVLGRLARLRTGASAARASLPTRLTEALAKLGPPYVKFGQLLATRPDIVGPELAKALAMLQDKLPPIPHDVALRIVEAELGKPADQLFLEIEPALAAASVAQVHRAHVADPSEPTGRRRVALKIMRPGVVAAFRRDIETFAFLARWVERLLPKTRRMEPVKLVETLARSATLELDLRLEAAAATELAEHMGFPDRRHATFYVPAVDWERTSRMVLTTEWVDGVPLSDLARLDAAGFDRKHLADLIIRQFLTQALDFGFFHADMHPGNLFVLPVIEPGRENGHEPGMLEGRLAGVDYGIMGRLDAATQRFMAEILFGFLTQDYRRVAIAHFDAGYVPRCHSVEDFAQALRAIGAPLLGKQARDISMARVLGQLFETTRAFDMHLRPELVLLQKTMVVVEGVARQLDPDVNMWESSRPVVEAWMTRTLGPEGRLTEAMQTGARLSRLIQRLPEIADSLERLSRLSAAQGGASPQELLQLAGRTELRRQGPTTAVVIATAVIALIAAITIAS